MTEIKKRLLDITTSIHNAEKKAQRSSNAVQLLAVSKTWPAEIVQQAVDAGQYHFGENYLQEALTKINALPNLKIVWHFIGPIQSNKTKDIAQNFDWVQSVDRFKIAQRLSNQRPENMAKLNVCIQVNIDNEISKSGVSAIMLLPLAEQISQLDHIQLRGLMIIPTKTDDHQQQQLSFQKARLLFDQLATIYPNIDTLSMGMSADMVIAISQGSTMVRIGTGLFGQRGATKGTSIN